MKTIRCALCGAMSVKKKPYRTLHQESCPVLEQLTKQAKEEPLVKSFISTFRGDLVAIYEPEDHK